MNGKIDKTLRRKITLGISTIDKELSFLEGKEETDERCDILFNVHDELEIPVENANILLEQII